MRSRFHKLPLRSFFVVRSSLTHYSCARPLNIVRIAHQASQADVRAFLAPRLVRVSSATAFSRRRLRRRNCPVFIKVPPHNDPILSHPFGQVPSGKNQFVQRTHSFFLVSSVLCIVPPTLSSFLLFPSSSFSSRKRGSGSGGRPAALFHRALPFRAHPCPARLVRFVVTAPTSSRSRLCLSHPRPDPVIVESTGLVLLRSAPLGSAPLHSFLFGVTG